MEMVGAGTTKMSLWASETSFTAVSTSDKLFVNSSSSTVLRSFLASTGCWIRSLVTPLQSMVKLDFAITVTGGRVMVLHGEQLICWAAVMAEPQLLSSL